MKSYSQAGQDVFAWESSGRKLDGTFLDIGSNDPVFHNNTYGLELVGWRGLCLDLQPFDYSKRRARFVQSDIAPRNSEVLQFVEGCNGRVDYLSVDVDDATTSAMRSIPFDRCTFGVITVEHDKYRVGDGIKLWIRSFLRPLGYTLAREDVLAPIAAGQPWSGQPFEDWYTHP